MSNSLSFNGRQGLEQAIQHEAARILGGRITSIAPRPEAFPYHVRLNWGWSEIRMAPSACSHQMMIPAAKVSDRSWTQMSGYTMADEASFAVVSIPSLSITSAVDLSSGRDVVRFSMGAIEIGNFFLPQWNMTMPIYSVYDGQRGAENLISRIPGLLQAGLGLFKEYMDAPSEVFGLPGEELPRVASTSLLVNGRDEASPVQRWRHWLACQALQHYGDLDSLEWWHPCASTKASMPHLART